MLYRSSLTRRSRIHPAIALLAVFSATFVLPAFAALKVTTPELHGLSIITPSVADTFALTVTNTGDAVETGRFTATLTPPSGQPEQQLDSPVSLAPGASAQLPNSLVGKELGVWSIAWKFTPETATSATTRPRPQTRTQRFAFMEPAGPNAARPAFRLGVVAHHERERDRTFRNREIAAAALVGAKTIRSNPSWGQIQPARDQWRWELMDDMLATFDAFNIECQVLLAYTPAWAADPSLVADKKDNNRNITRSAPDLEAWRTFVSTFSTRYKGRIPLWEPWNEPDLGFWRGTTEQYIELATIALDEIRRTDPAAKVMSGGFATLKPHAGRFRNPDMHERVMRTLGPRFDFHAAHEHSAFDIFSQLVDGPYATLRASLPKPVPPLFFNETAITAIGGSDAEKHQAITLVKKATFARSRGAVGYLWYDLRNDGTDPGNGEHNYGLVTRDFQPKPVFTTYNTLARLAIPRPFLRQLDAGPSRWLFLHGDAPDASNTSPPPPHSSSRLLVFWNDDVASQNEQLLLRLPGATRASLLDINGNATPLALADESVVVNTASTPLYLLAENATDITLAGRLAGATRVYYAAPGQTLTVACEFTNPTDRILSVNTKWTTPLTMQVLTPPSSSALMLPPHSKITSAVTVRVPQGPAYRFGQTARLRVDYDYVNSPWSGRFLIPVRYAAIVVNDPALPALPASSSTTNASRRAPEITLDRKEQVHSFIEADPQLEHQRWRGPENLSARVWIGADTTSLLLRIAVTDNHHQQTQEPNALWKEDSVQCVIDVPGQNGSWKIELADHDTRGPLTMIWNRPVGARDSQPAIRLSTSKPAVASQDRIYEARISRADLGLTDEILRDGFRFNIAVNDHDGTVRAHAIELSPGLVLNKSTENLPCVMFTQLPAP
ncbi:hypothetical protein [Geminisphaera colitermitum]|uniref:hypothetical protein n=1 Tax=Geminisphaera colitermitum TaxID=1148786 RepID=UPI000158CE1C|nr:hypothetical protein [Geminisphaera colitermitum]